MGPHDCSSRSCLVARLMALGGNRVGLSYVLGLYSYHCRCRGCGGTCSCEQKGRRCLQERNGTQVGGGGCPRHRMGMGIHCRLGWSDTPYPPRAITCDQWLVCHVLGHGRLSPFRHVVEKILRRERYARSSAARCIGNIHCWPHRCRRCTSSAVLTRVLQPMLVVAPK